MGTAAGLVAGLAAACCTGLGAGLGTALAGVGALATGLAVAGAGLARGGVCAVRAVDLRAAGAAAAKACSGRRAARWVGAGGRGMVEEASKRFRKQKAAGRTGRLVV